MVIVDPVIPALVPEVWLLDGPVIVGDVLPAIVKLREVLSLIPA